MARQYVEAILDRSAHNAINDNFKELYNDRSMFRDGLKAVDDLISRYGVFAKNIINNGDFSNGIDGFGVYGNDADYIISANTISLTGKGAFGTTGLRSLGMNDFVAKKKHQIYIKARMRVTNSEAIGFKIYLASGSDNAHLSGRLVENPLINTWYERSGVITVPDHLDEKITSIYFVAEYPSNTIANGKTFEIYRPMAIDLTDTFGFGNEWSNADTTDFLNSYSSNAWFNGQIEVSNLSEKLNELQQSFHQYKNNQTSIGDYRLVDDFSTGWTTTDSNLNLSLRKDERVNLTNHQSLRMKVINSAKAQKNIDKKIVIPSADLNTPKMIKVWIKDPQKIDYLSVYFGNSDSSWTDSARYAFKGDGGGDFAVAGGILRKGWNFLSLVNSEAILNGAFSFSKDVKRVRVSVTPIGGEDTEIVLDSLWTNGVSDARFVITFDDAWRTVYENAYPKMKQAGVVGTTYVIGEYIENIRAFSDWFMTKEMLKEIEQNEWCLANHTWTHDYYFGGKHTPRTYVDVLNKNTEWMLANGLGADGAYHVCYPKGEYDQEVIALMKKEGYKSARAAGSRGTHPIQIDKEFEVISRNFHKDVTIEQAKKWIDAGLESGGTTFLQFHQIPLDDTTSNEHENPYISWSKDKFIELIDYIVAKNIQDKFMTHSEWYDYCVNNKLIKEM